MAQAAARRPWGARINQALRPVPAWPIYLIALIPPVWLLWQGLTGALGPDPVKVMEHWMGLRGLQVLVAVLAVTPLRNLTGISLVKYRRALGLVAFFYILLHLAIWLVLDVQLIGQIVADILKRPYITIGMAAFALMIPLALTSNNLSIRKMGPLRWRRLQRLIYLIVPLGAVHFFMLVKGWQIEPMVYMAVIAALLALRLPALARIRLF